MFKLSEKEIEQWPKIVEKKQSGRKNNRSRIIEIEDARNHWKIEIIDFKNGVFALEGFSLFYFIYKLDHLSCFKKIVSRKSDSGELSAHDDRFNLICDSGERKTLRMKTFKTYLPSVFKEV